MLAKLFIGIYINLKKLKYVIKLQNTLFLLLPNVARGHISVTSCIALYCIVRSPIIYPFLSLNITLSTFKYTASTFTIFTEGLGLGPNNFMP